MRYSINKLNTTIQFELKIDPDVFQRMPIPVLSITINKMQINNGLISEAINVKQSGEPSFHTHVTKGC